MNAEKIAVMVVVIPVVIVIALVSWYGQTSLPGHGEDGVRVFNLTGFALDGVWTLEDVNGWNYWWKRFEPATLYMERGDEVVVNLRSADLFHRFYIPEFAVGPVDVEPGHMATVRFIAARAGVFQYYCTSMCGRCHFYMRGWVVVTEPGQEPIEPPPITCLLCSPGPVPPPAGRSLIEVGAYLYLAKGCVTCHGIEGAGGIANPNSANSPVPAHHTTVEKLFLASPEDTEAFIELLEETGELGKLEEPPDIARLPIVLARYKNAKQIIRGGRYSGKLDPSGPEPPLQMPAWQHLVEEREIDALLSYFLSLYPWEEDGDADVS